MTLLLSLPTTALVALAVAAVTVPLVRRLALRLGLVDDPSAGAYKTHRKATAYGGGVAIWIGAVVPLSAGAAWLAATTPGLLRDGGGWMSPWAPYLLFPLQPLSPTVQQVSQAVLALTAATLLLVVGLVDDRRVLPPGLRLGLQLVLAAGLGALDPDFRLLAFGGPAWIGIGGGAVWIVALTNAYNFLDNMNGLSAGLAAVTLAATGAIALAQGHLPVTFLCLAVAGAAAGFLLHNFPRASIFMGDAGGLFLGFLGGSLSLLLSGSAAGADLSVRLLPLAVFTVPLYDLITVVGLRLRAHRAPWLGDTNHISHRLVAAGLDRTRAVLFLYAVTAMTALPCAAASGSGSQGAWWPLLGVAGWTVLLGAADLTVARHRRQ